MAVSDQEVAAWLAANPTASNAEIAQAAAAAGVDANQFERVTGTPAPFEVTYGGEMNTPIAYSTKQNIGKDVIDIQYGPEGQQLSAIGMPTTINGQRVVTDYSPSGQASYRLYNQPGMFNELLNAAAYLGKGYGLVTGLDSLLGNLPSLGSSAASSAADADIAGGMIPEYGTNQAYDAFMSQAMTPEAIAALEKQIAESSVGGFNYQDILNQGGMITDIASGNFMGPLTADELGNAFEKYMAESGYFPITNINAPVSTVVTPPTTTVPTTTTPTVTTPTVTTPTTVIPSVITKLLPGLLTAGAVNKAVTPSPTSTTPLTTGITTPPVNNQDYYNAIQQYYNAYMPEVPRDVTTPLQQWYDSKYGA